MKVEHFLLKSASIFVSFSWQTRGVRKRQFPCKSPRAALWKKWQSRIFSTFLRVYKLYPLIQIYRRNIRNLLCFFFLLFFLRNKHAHTFKTNLSAELFYIRRNRSLCMRNKFNLLFISSLNLGIYRFSTPTLGQLLIPIGYLQTF